MGNSRILATDEITSFRDLIAWQRAFALGLAVYEVTRSFPDSERFGLVSQLRRGAVSIASNIAEGYGRGSRTDYSRFLRMSRGALFELETQLLFAFRLDYITKEQFDRLNGQLDEAARVLSGLLRSLKTQ